MTKESGVVLFGATAHALRADKLARMRGFRCGLVPVPRHLSSDCGLALEVSDHLRAVADLLRQEGVHIEAVHTD